MIGSGPSFASWVEDKGYASQGVLRDGKWLRLPTWNRGEEANLIEAERRCLRRSVTTGVGCGLVPSRELTCDLEGPSTATDRGGYDEGGLMRCNPTSCVKAPCRIMLNCN